MRTYLTRVKLLDRLQPLPSLPEQRGVASTSQGQRVGGVTRCEEAVKPAISRSTLQVALVLVGATLVAVGEAPGIDKLIGQPWAHLLAILGGVLGGSQLLKRVGDFAPSEVTLVEGERVSKP
jgi:hypothetical protein